MADAETAVIEIGESKRESKKARKKGRENGKNACGKPSLSL